MAKWAVLVLCFMGVMIEAYSPGKYRIYNIIRNPGILFEEVQNVYLQENSLELVSLINMNYIYNIHPYYKNKINAVPGLNQTITKVKSWIEGLEELENFDNKISKYTAVINNIRREGILVDSRLTQEWTKIAKEMYEAENPVNLTQKVKSFLDTLINLEKQAFPEDLFTPETWKNISENRPNIIKAKNCDLTHELKLRRVNTEVLALKLKIPQLQLNHYKVFKLHRPALFSKVGKSNVASQVKFRSDYMGINHFRNQMFFISETELSNLPICENKKYFRRPPVIQSSSTCEAELLVYSRLTCEIVDTESKEPTISQTESGIIFSFSQPVEAVILCPDFKQVKIISGLGITDLPVQCEIKINETVFKGTTTQPVSLVVQDAHLEIGNMSQFITKPLSTKTPVIVKPKLTSQYIIAASFQYHVEIL